MKINQAIGLLTLGIALVSIPIRAQTTPTGTANSTTYPQGAIATDSMPSSKASGSQKRNRNSRSTTNQNSRTGSSSSTTSDNQDDRYRQNSATYGTTINNSNSTNYNSNNVTTAPTGVGSTSTTSGSSTTPPRENDQTSSNQNAGSNSGSTSSMSDGAQKNGTAAAVVGARTTKEPAVKAGSTERNTSISDFIASSPNYVTLQNAIQSAELYQTLAGAGPYTIFAPSNAAFKKLPATMQGGLLEGRNRDALKQLLSYHVIKGSIDGAELTKQIKAGNGKAQLKTLSDNTLVAQVGPDGRITLMDQQGGTAYVEVADNKQSNGVVHGISAVLLPKAETAIFR